MFELLNPTKVKIADVVVLSQKNRMPDDNPGAKISVEMQLANDVLGHFDGFLRGFLYTANAGVEASSQKDLEGVAPVSDMPHLTAIGRKAGWINWDDEFTGYTTVVDYGIAGRSNLELADCVLSGWRFKANEGGTVDVRFNIESNDVSEKAFGRLAKMKSTEVDTVIRPPEIGQQDIEETRLTPAQLRKANAEGKSPEQALAEAAGVDSPVDGESAWPFPKGANSEASGADVNPPAAPTSRRAPVKYRDPATGMTWSGRGLKPKWLATALDEGRTLAEFEVTEGASA